MESDLAELAFYPTGQCIHCGNPTKWIDDPAPDLCAMCAVAGRWSALWGPNKLAEYRLMLSRLMKRNDG